MRHNFMAPAAQPLDVAFGATVLLVILSAFLTPNISPPNLLTIPLASLSPLYLYTTLCNHYAHHINRFVRYFERPRSRGYQD
jgi:hypothetical protein